MDRILIFLGSVFLLTLAPACRQASKPSDQAQQSAASSAPAAEKLYPSIPEEKLKMLWDKCDYIDIVFYYANFSMNQSEQPSIRRTLSQVATEVPVINPSCQAQGRLFFQQQGQILMEAELFLGEGCVYYIFLENGQRAYANELTPEGLQFYQNVFNQVQQRTTGQQPQ